MQHRLATVSDKESVFTMSVKYQGLVWDSDLPRAEKFVCLAYADHADHEGRNIRPSLALVMWKTGYKRRQVINITQSLEAMGILIPDGKGHFGENQWAMDAEKLPQRASWQEERARQKGGAKNAPVQKTHRAKNSEGGAKNAHRGCKKQHARGAKNAPDPTINNHHTDPPDNHQQHKLPPVDNLPEPECDGDAVVEVDPRTQRFLQLAGVSGRQLSQLAEIPPEEVLPTILQAASKGLGVGWLITQLSAEYPAELGFIALGEWMLSADVEDLDELEESLRYSIRPPDSLPPDALHAARALWRKTQSLDVQHLDHLRDGVIQVDRAIQLRESSYDTVVMR